MTVAKADAFRGLACAVSTLLNAQRVYDQARRSQNEAEEDLRTAYYVYKKAVEEEGRG